MWSPGRDQKSEAALREELLSMQNFDRIERLEQLERTLQARAHGHTAELVISDLLRDHREHRQRHRKAH